MIGYLPMRHKQASCIKVDNAGVLSGPASRSFLQVLEGSLLAITSQSAVGIKPDCLLRCFYCLLVISQFVESCSFVRMSCCILGIKLDGLLIRFYRLLAMPLSIESIPLENRSSSILRIKPDGLFTCLHRLLVSPQFVESSSFIDVSCC